MRRSPSAHARTIGTYWLVVARNGVGSATRPSSSSMMTSSTADMPMPPSSAGTVRLGQSSSTNVFHSAAAVVAAVDHGPHERGRALALGDVPHDALQLELLVVQLEVHGGALLVSGLAGQQPVEVGPQLGRA